ncbi:MAG TPA: precorrin-2 C(20)-methyltransferase [Streptosporangiaceae bacterium]|nr:precorrin-2 C(20)-methyltransferase [Streptosporangiaceae bacterium]
MRRLIGVGVGPGDPELITVKAIRVLRTADLVLVPVLGRPGEEDRAETGRAEATVRAHVDDAVIRRVAFALNDTGGVTPGRASAWDAAADAVTGAFAAGAGTVAFATLGDPALYSTFSYLAQSVTERDPGVTVETVPGITALQDLAARSGTVLAEGTESLVLLPLTAGPGALAEALAAHDTVVAYKLSAAGPLETVRKALAEVGRLDSAVFGARVGLAGEDIRPAASVEAGERVPYLATLISTGRRGGRGSRLGGKAAAGAAAAAPAERAAGPARGTAGPADGTAGAASGATDPAPGTADPARGTADPVRGTAGPADGAAGAASGDADADRRAAGPADGIAGAASEAAGPANGTAGPASGAADSAGQAGDSRGGST